ncbi:SAM hydrolase/SAM-dependent halogenase family protein [Abyssalbus ytuae]|uniref:SAM-dependent chlorinase/fluorinase n=1 Tax=Abyssalbus ytuae TaxID=2926907 RepID=A0A9E6ZLA1_9FLAO|nr:SAM-dependent chlorinase/fluorinase [Abyssalbus ytuae]UOB17864.1 SAM-dependent chlorinase/fluorinase [Abyssalbus ytuae]
MAIITLTTDFGEKDHFAGAIKGAIYKEIENVVVVDISHTVDPFNIQEAAYIIQNAYKSFPDGSIHIIGVDSELTPENKHIAVFLNNHYFICADNGIVSILATEFNPEKIVEINIHDRVESIFPALDIFAKVAAHIARGGTLEVIGKLIKGIKPVKELAPLINNEQNQISGSVIYIDNYGNVITNITRKLFDTVRKGRDFELYARNHQFTVIHNKYSDAINFNIEKSRREDDGKKLAVFNSGGFIEIAVYRSNLNTVGGASTLLGLRYRDTVTIKFL